MSEAEAIAVRMRIASRQMSLSLGLAAVAMRRLGWTMRWITYYEHSRPGSPLRQWIDAGKPL